MTDDNEDGGKRAKRCVLLDNTLCVCECVPVQRIVLRPARLESRY